MFLVNFLGAYAAVHPVLKHHNTYCSYADTIMPQFFFAVGYAYRLTFLRRCEKEGARVAWQRALGRGLGLVLFGLVFYGLDGGFKAWSDLGAGGLWSTLAVAFRRNAFQTLVHIGVTTLWVLPVIGARPAVRIGFLVGSAVLHLTLSRLFYYDWAMAVRVIDGGPLGFLSWTIPTLAGSLAYDVVRQRGPRRALAPLAGGALVLMVLGYGLSCLNRWGAAAAAVEGLGRWLVEPPFVAPGGAVDLWTMSQRAGSISYLTFAAGFSLAVYAGFVALCDLGSFRLGVFRTLGVNALAGYVLHDMTSDAIKPFIPRDAPLWYALAGFALFFWLTWFFLRFLEKNKIFLRL